MNEVMGTVMHERQLADLFIHIGVDRGVNVDQIATDLAEVSLPSFVDEAAFKASLLDAIETQLRRQTDERIQQLRQQLTSQVAPAASQGRVQLDEEPSIEEEEPIDQAESRGRVALDDTNQTVVVDEDLPEDATMVWHTQEERKEN